ncbi:MAG: SIR2 family NAD-dependent protein deacylase [Bacteroidales bacterium]
MMNRKTIVVLTGAGISAESGISTFRDNNGLWRNYRFEEVASPEAWQRDPGLVLEFYNMRRKKVFEAEPNEGHKALVRLEKAYNVQIITQNVDDLHERAGSTQVLHLHGEIKKARSTVDPSLIYELKHWELKLGDRCEKGSQLRPHVVWFGEPVPEFSRAVNLARKADIFIVVGTSLNVYPAASLIHYVPTQAPKYYIDPSPQYAGNFYAMEVVSETAGKGLSPLVDKLLAEAEG